MAVTPDADRIAYAKTLLASAWDIDPERRSGRPVLKGTGFTVAQMLAEIADGRSPEQIADDFDLPLQPMKDVLDGLAILLDEHQVGNVISF